MKDDNNSINDKLNHLFQDLIPAQDAPEMIKQEVFQTLETLNLIGDIADLFTAKFSKTEMTFLDILGDAALDDTEENSDNPSELSNDID